MSRAEKLAEAERFDAEAVAQHLTGQGVAAQAFASNAALLEKLCAETLPPASGARPPRVVAFFTNGSFDGIIPKFVAAAKG